VQHCLVGSEMCIRDSLSGSVRRCAVHTQPSGARVGALNSPAQDVSVDPRIAPGRAGTTDFLLLQSRAEYSRARGGQFWCAHGIYTYSLGILMTAGHVLWQRYCACAACQLCKVRRAARQTFDRRLRGLHLLSGACFQPIPRLMSRAACAMTPSGGRGRRAYCVGVKVKQGRFRG
jgi:hypothetical protein